MKTYRVLVPLDGSPLSEAVLPHVLGLSPGPDELSVRLLRVLPPPSPFCSDPEPSLRRRVADAEADLGRLASALRHRGLRDVSTVVAPGDPATEILAHAADLGAGLIAMTTHGQGGFKRFVLGGTAARVIRLAPVSVLALRAGEAVRVLAPRPVFDRVLVPHDGAEEAFRAVERVALFAGPERRPAVTLLRVVESWNGIEPAGPVLAAGGAAVHDVAGALARQYLKLVAEGARRDLEHVAARARDLGLQDVRCEVIVGRIAPTILDTAEALGATLIAMTTHGRSGLSRWALGSVTERVLEASPVPLLVSR